LVCEQNQQADITQQETKATEVEATSDVINAPNGEWPATADIHSPSRKVPASLCDEETTEGGETRSELAVSRAFIHQRVRHSSQGVES
jgi:hypothetical protein